ncbi:hypothetical protein QBC38DRAFT_512847 [Podospora fimiseda]|uniref:GDP/GTP exchange factor Sec2 N-terminal domain-containing protein n=1 Tax=Podospora fimiseda TaxID=252190 RepID=A0AAN7BFS0_9PEZI|nr:hypothetical protein QBC38DRAFT_512847 [Podospora fimiseda]
MAVTNKMWQSFVAVTAWSSHPAVQPSARPRTAHNRSLSSILRSASPKPAPSHARSVSTIDSSMTADAARSIPSTPQPKRLFPPPELDDENDLSTIPDPRSRAISPANPDTMTSSHHPDLDQEVATLSTKLINAINHQTTLDDNLSVTRLELEKAREKTRQLEEQIAEQREMLAGDVWVRRKTVEAEKTKLLARVAEEKRLRLDMEQQKKKIEQELENLTAALFEEANKMVISAKEEARAEQEVLHRKNDQLKAQLVDTEGLLRSQQEQLAELKHVMEMMTLEKEEQIPTCPSSPSVSKFDATEIEGPAASAPHHSHHHHHHHRSISTSVPISPSYPTSFTHLLHPVLRTDLATYGDFRDLLRASKRISGQRIPSSTSSSALTSLGLGLGSMGAHVAGANASSTSLSTLAATPATSPQTPNTPASSVSAGSSVTPTTLVNLKETKFFKRVLTEDIEPTLRLDIAPGLSWLARRSVITAMTEGTLVVEPAPSTATGRFGKIMKPELYPCSLCGESRKEEPFLRTHRFRTSESDSTQNAHPLCKYCLARVRSTCDFLGFLRIVKDGHWRTDDEDAEKAAWEESVRLREQMFWSRIGGGVVPAGHSHRVTFSAAPSIRGERSPRPSHEMERAVDVTGPVKVSFELPKTPEQNSLELPKTPEHNLSAQSKQSLELPRIPERDPSAETVKETAPPTPEKDAVVEETAQSAITEAADISTDTTPTPQTAIAVPPSPPPVDSDISEESVVSEKQIDAKPLAIAIP